MIANPMPDAPAQTDLPPRGRHVAGTGAVLLTLAWLALGLGHLSRPTTDAQLPPRQLNNRIHVNDDDAVRLQLLSGIGPRLAERIVARREQVGPFQSHAELEEVHHVGPRLMERIEPWLRLAPPAE